MHINKKSDDYTTQSAQQQHARTLFDRHFFAAQARNMIIRPFPYRVRKRALQRLAQLNTKNNKESE